MTDVPPPTPPPRPATDEDLVRAVTTRLADLPGPLLPILHELQNQLGHIPPAALPLIADELNLSTAEVHGVVTFYRDFRTTPGGRSTVRICTAEACHAVGAGSLAEHAQRVLDADFGSATSDGRVQLENVFCLGNCALGPAVQVDGTLHGRVTPPHLDALLEALP